MIENELRTVLVVGSGTIQREISLDALQEDISGEAWQDESEQPGLFHKFEEDGPVTTFYNSGNFILRADTPEELFEAKERLLKELESLGILDADDVDSDFTIENIVKCATLDMRLNLPALVVELGLETAEYEPMQFPAVIFRDKSHGCVYLIYSNGEIVITGGTDEEEEEKSFEEFKEQIREFKTFTESVA